MFLVIVANTNTHCPSKGICKCVGLNDYQGGIGSAQYSAPDFCVVVEILSALLRMSDCVARQGGLVVESHTIWNCPGLNAYQGGPVICRQEPQ